MTICHTKTMMRIVLTNITSHTLIHFGMSQVCRWRDLPHHIPIVVLEAGHLFLDQERWFPREVKDEGLLIVSRCQEHDRMRKGFMN